MYPEPLTNILNTHHFRNNDLAAKLPVFVAHDKTKQNDCCGLSTQTFRQMLAWCAFALRPLYDKTDHALRVVLVREPHQT